MKGITLPTIVPGQSARIEPLPMVKIAVGTGILVALGLFGWGLGNWLHKKASGPIATLGKGVADTAESIKEGL